MSRIKCNRCKADAEDTASNHGESCRCGGRFYYPPRDLSEDPFAKSSWETIMRLSKEHDAKKDIAKLQAFVDAALDQERQ